MKTNETPDKHSASHTPGPWRVDPTGDIGPWIIGDSEDFIADCNCNNSIEDETTEANARLIAAAPDLLECVKEALKVDISLRFGLRRQFEAALAKTEAAK